MKRILYTLAIILIITWVLGVFIFTAGMFIHILLIVAAILCMQAIINRPKPQQNIE
jgi:hypothetical protein